MPLARYGRRDSVLPLPELTFTSLQGRHGSVAAEIAPGPAPEAARRNSAIYLDSSITFEDYHFWANRSRDYEKTLETAHMGLAGWGRMLIGKGEHHGTPPDVAAPDGSSGDEKATEKAGEAGVTTIKRPSESRYGITESEWDNAQRAVRTATWGESVKILNRCTWG
jgi:hypothetical protein